MSVPAGGRPRRRGHRPRPPRGSWPRRRSGERGQATVELALCLPVVMVLLLAVVQVTLIARDQVLAIHAAREAARARAVDPRDGAAARRARATPGLDPRRLTVTPGRRGPPGSEVSVTVRYRSATEVPLVGALVGDPVLTATVTMAVEGDTPP